MAATFSPESLQFTLRAGRTAKEILTINNVGQERIIFKIKTTSPEEYSVRPPMGVIEAGKSFKVHLSYQALQKMQLTYAESTSEQKSDKFMILTATLTEGVTGLQPSADDLKILWNNIPTNSVRQHKITCEIILEEQNETQSITSADESTVVEETSTIRGVTYPHEAHSNEAQELAEELKSAKEQVTRLQKELAAFDQGRGSPTRSPSGKKLSSRVESNDAVHAHLARLNQPRPKEGYPSQVLIIVGVIVFIITYLFF